MVQIKRCFLALDQKRNPYVFVCHSESGVDESWGCFSRVFHAILPISGGADQQPIVVRQSDTDPVYRQVQPDSGDSQLKLAVSGTLVIYLLT